MRHAKLIRRGLALAPVLALPLAAGAAATYDDDRGKKHDRGEKRQLVATTADGKLIKFNAKHPGHVKSSKTITGLPAGVSLKGIDFRPATGDLYGVGSDSVVYRVNPRTAIAVAEAPPFTPTLRGAAFGVDFNPVVDKIRVVSDARQNLRLNVDEGTVLMADPDLNPGSPQVTHAGYTNSSFSATRPTATQLYVIDAGVDKLYLQNPANAGTLTMPKSLGIDVSPEGGFDIAGAQNTGYLAVKDGRGGSKLYKVDVTTGATKKLGSVGWNRGTVVTGLAAWQD